MEQYLPLAALIVGLLARIFIPWLAVRRRDPEAAKWDWNQVWPQILSFVMIVLLLPLLVSDLRMIWDMEPQAAWLVGWATGDIGRKTYKALAKEGGE
jgi:hypothetical protein